MEETRIDLIMLNDVEDSIGFDSVELFDTDACCVDNTRRCDADVRVMVSLVVVTRSVGGIVVVVESVTNLSSVSKMIDSINDSKYHG